MIAVYKKFFLMLGVTVLLCLSASVVWSKSDNNKYEVMISLECADNLFYQVHKKNKSNLPSLLFHFSTHEPQIKNLGTYKKTHKLEKKNETDFYFFANLHYIYKIDRVTLNIRQYLKRKKIEKIMDIGCVQLTEEEYDAINYYWDSKKDRQNKRWKKWKKGIKLKQMRQF